MSSNRSDEVRDYAFGDRVLALRKRAGLTQAQWAAALGASKRTIEGWEAGLTYPGVERLMALVALALERGLFMGGREEEEAAALWDIPRRRASQRIPPFEPHLFPALRRDAGAARPAAPPLPEAADTARRHDWGEAPAMAVVQGRGAELATLAGWLRAERCRVVEVLGAGGIGKTTLAAQVARDLAPELAAVYWRSLRNAPPPEEWLAGAIAALSEGQAAVPEGFDARLALLLELLRGQRALLVLDNLETILEPGSPVVRYRAGYEGYGETLARLVEAPHEGRVLLTGREQPLAADETVVRALRLGGLGVEAARALLGGRALRGDETAWQALVEHYGGNPLALSIAGETIVAVFGGDVAAFLAQETAVFGGIRQLLDAQVGRLSAPERAILDWLAVEREPVGFTELAADLEPEVARAEAVEAVEALLRRSLLEWGTGGAFTLQPVVLEYVTARLVATVSREILAGTPALLVSQPVLKATARDYVRRSQERLIAGPLLDRLSATLGGVEPVERRLLELVGVWRGQSPAEQGYGPGNVVNLLRLLSGELRGLDLSRLAIRQAYLQGVEAQDASLAGAHLFEVVLAEAFTYPTAVALSADGAYLAVGTSTGEVCLLRVVDRMLLVAVQGHAGPIPGLATSGDGRLMASGSYDGTVKLWEALTGHLLSTLRGHTGGIWCVALNRDGTLMASGGLDKAVNVWEIPGGRLLATLRGHTGEVWGVALSEDGRLVASGSQDGTVKLWEVPTGRLLATLHGHIGGVWAVALSRDGKVVVSGGYDETVRVWDIDGGDPLSTLRGHTGGIWGMALSRDGKMVASGSQDGTVKLWEVDSQRLLTTLQGHTSGVRDVALSTDGALVASGGLDGTVNLWDIDGGHLLASLQGQTGGTWSVALSRDGELVACGSQDGTVRVWDTDGGRPLATLHGHSGGIYSVALSGSGRLVASGGLDGTINLWDIDGGRLLATLQGHAGAIRGVALSTDGALLAGGSQDGTVKLWDTDSGQLLATLQGHTGGVDDVALSTDGVLLASGSLDGTVKLWEIPGGRLLATLRGHASGVWSVALSGDGRLVAGGSQDGTVNLWDTDSGQLLTTLRGHSSVVLDVALSGGGQLAASSSFDGTVKLWDTPSGQLLATLRGHRGAVLDVALSGDGRLVASGSYDGTVKLWDAHSGACLRTLRGERHYERMDITGLTGVTAAQRAMLHGLGAIEHERATDTGIQPASTRTSYPPQTGPAIELDTVLAPARSPAVPPPSVRSPTNLPPARTSFIGRAADVAALAQALDPATGAGARLLTLSGVAGSGKTRLALAVAEAVRESYGEGTWLVELAPLPVAETTDPTTVAAATLDALGLREQPGQAPADTLVARLQVMAGRVLLVLDNCEHVVAACAALVARLLGACPTLQILSTSQRPLGIADETIWRVDTLAAPPPIDGAPAPALLRLVGQSEAAQLFVERARAVRSDFTLSAGNAAGVAAICRRLDGLPLAIELAAARLHVLPVAEVLARLDDRFRLLRLGGRIVADRHQTLQATLDWSYGLLDPAEQALLRRLAVFAGGWELAAAEAVCAEGEVAADAVLELLDELLERSLVYVYDAGGTPRYGLLETVRQYGVQQLERMGEADAVRGRHVAWCAMLAEQAAPALLGPEQAAWLARLDQEHDNMRSALRWALDRGLSTLGLRVAGGLGKFWLRGGHQREGRRWLAAVLALPPGDDDPAATAVRATALEGAAGLAEDAHDFAGATALFVQSEALRRALGQDERLTAGRINAAMEARAHGDYARATTLLEESLAQYRTLGNREGTARDSMGPMISFAYRYTLLALVLTEQGAYARATTLCEECLALTREAGDVEGSGVALLSLADVARDQGDARRVRQYGEESLTLFRELGHPWAIGFALNDLAQAAYLEGDLPLAARRAEESATVFRGMEAGPSLAEALITLGRIRAARGAVAAARADLTEALALAGEAGPRLVVAAALGELGVQAVGQGHTWQGARLLGAAARMRQEMGTPMRLADRPAIEGALAAARASLGDATFTDAWAAGQTQPLDHIVAQAVAGPGDDVVARDMAEL